MEFTAPAIDYGAIWPLLVVGGAGCLGVLLEAFVPHRRRHRAQTLLTLVALAVALIGTVVVGAGDATATAAGALVVDGPGLVLWGLLLVLSLGGVLLFTERRLDGGVSVFAGHAAAMPGSRGEREAAQRRMAHTEVYPLLLFAVTGMMLFVVAGDLLLLFVALEVLSLPLYLLAGLARRRRLLSQEAALKYFLLGAFSSAFFLYGLALVYGFAGTMDFAGIEEAAAASDTPLEPLLLIGLALMLVGLLFKVGAVPFHAWTPDVYQGSPTPVTAWMSAATKVAAFGAMLRLLYVGFGLETEAWQPTLGLIAVLTMFLGAVFALVQTDMKRMLGYSAVAHTGFLLVGVVGVGGEGIFTSTEAVFFYLVAYGIASLGAFAVVSLVRGRTGEAGELARWAGLGRRAPWTGAIFTLFLLSMAGIPLTAGFVGKWAVFAVALDAGEWGVVALAVAASIVAVFFYVRVVLLMYFTEPEPGVTPGEVVLPSPATSVVVGVTAVATLVLGVLPGPVLNLIGDAGGFLG